MWETMGEGHTGLKSKYLGAITTSSGVESLDCYENSKTKTSNKYGGASIQIFE